MPKASWLWHWRARMFGPPWFRRFMWCWDVYWSDDPFVWWSDVKDLCGRLSRAEAALRAIAEPGSMGVTDIARRALTQIDAGSKHG